MAEPQQVDSISLSAAHAAAAVAAVGGATAATG